METAVSVLVLTHVGVPDHEGLCGVDPRVDEERC